MASGGYIESDKTAGPPKGVLLNFCDFKIEETISVTLSSAAGLKADWASGIIQDVEESSPLHLQGIRAGMRLVALDIDPYSTRLMNRKIAFGKRFVAVFATGVSVEYPLDHPEEGFAVKTFPGDVPMGLSFGQETGRIGKVEEGSPAADQGIRVGMLIRYIDGEPFAAHKITSAKKSFEVLLLKYPEAPGRHAAQVISRSIRSLPDEESWHKAADFSWMEDWHPDDRVPDYLGRFGFDAADCDKWQRCPSEGLVKLGINVDRREERPKTNSAALGAIGALLKKANSFGHTWYVIECTISNSSSNITSWLAPRRLEHIQKFLELRVRESLGNRYEWLFEDFETIPSGGTASTTKFLNKWLNLLVAHINDGLVSPELCALTLSFLLAPITSDARETPAPDLFLAPVAAEFKGSEVYEANKEANKGST